MPLVRAKVRSEYGLGSAELYKEASRQEDPKAILDGVAVAGLIGILRQLGDLAEFAAEVFHGLQEQVMTTSSRSHKLITRVRNIEMSLPALEKAVFAQTSHVHFAYVAGCDWHPRQKKENRGFACDDLPRFILDSYEECRDPPRLHMLDKFDTGGPGSCLKRYSDPTFFRRGSNNLKESDAIQFHKDKKSRKSKKRRSLQIDQDSSFASTSNLSGSIQSGTSFTGRRSPPNSISHADVPLNSDIRRQRISFDHIIIPKNGNHLHSAKYAPVGNKDYALVSSTLNEHCGTSFPDKSEIAVGSSDDIVLPYTSPEHIGSRNRDMFRKQAKNEAIIATEKVDLMNYGDEHGDIGSDADHFVDALNVIDSESDNDLDHQAKHEGRESRLISQANFSGDQIGRDRSGVQANHEIGYSVRSNNIVPCLPKLDESSDPRSVSSSDLDDSCHALKGSLLTTTMPVIDASGTTLVPMPANVDSRVDSDAVCKNSSKQSSEDNLHKSMNKPRVVEPLMDSQSSVNDSSLIHVTSVNDRSIIHANSVNGLPFKSGCGCSVNSSVMESKESEAPLSETCPINIWTNGVLLGLEPSKPNHFSMPSVAKDGSVGNERAKRQKPAILNDDMQKVETNVTCSTSCRSDIESQVNCGDKVDYSCHNGHKNVVTSKIEGPENEKHEDVLASSSQACQLNEGNTPKMFEFGHRFLGNGSRGTLSQETDRKRERSSIPKTSISDVNLRTDKPGSLSTPGNVFKEEFRWKLDVDSPTSSPPLKHMNISFNPTDLFSVSKLKLKYPDALDSHENSRGLYPSFQLVPEKILSLDDVVSASDDDTFCRSSLYASDDYSNNGSDLDSELWEGEDPKPTSPVQWKPVNADDSTDSPLSPTILDLPCLDSTFHEDSILQQQCDFNHQHEKESHHAVLNPLSQWQDLKSTLNAMEVQYLGGSGPLLETKVPAMSQQINPESTNYEMVNSPLCKEVDKVGQKEHLSKISRTSEVRNMMVNPCHASVPVNDKVTAILRKADSILQAVGDEEDDDSSWSD